MKRLLILIICSTVMMLLFSVVSHGNESITLEEVNDLVEEVEALSIMLYFGGIDNYISSEKASEDVCNGMNEEYGCSFRYGDVHCAREGMESVEYWENKLKGIFTEDYFTKSNILYKTSGMMAYNGKVYFVEGMMKNIPFPSYAMSTGETTLSLVDDNTAKLTAYYEKFDHTDTYMLEFENTPAGWRISGGSAADGYMGVKADNPQTSDVIVFIHICVLVSVLGFAVTAKRRRYINIT